jgi:hypothetical protein
MRPAPQEPSPLDFVLEELSALNMFTFVFELDPELLGFPMNRPRLWILCLPSPRLHGMTHADSDSFLVDAMDLCCSRAGQQLGLARLVFLG